MLCIVTKDSLGDSVVKPMKVIYSEPLIAKFLGQGIENFEFLTSNIYFYYCKATILLPCKSDGKP